MRIKSGARYNDTSCILCNREETAFRGIPRRIKGNPGGGDEKGKGDAGTVSILRAVKETVASQ